MNRLWVFGWHNVEGTWCFPSESSAGLRGLERQLRGLQRAARVVPLGEALAALANGRRLGPRAVALTFDDGYRDNLDLAVPLLERLGLPATFFLVPGLLSREAQPWWETLGWAFESGRRKVVHWEDEKLELAPATRRADYDRVAERLKRRSRAARDTAVSQLVELFDPSGDAPRTDGLFLDWDGARDIVRRGFEVGSHSMYHAILTEEPPEDQYRDLEQSRQLLQAELGVTIDLLAYPNGGPRDFDRTTLAATRAAGYSHALTTLHGPNRAGTADHELRRFLVCPERGAPGLAVVAPPAVLGYRALKRVGRRLQRLGHSTVSP